MDMKVGGKLRNFITKEELDRFFAKSGYDRIYVTNLVVTDWGFASWDVSNDGYLFVMSCYGDAKLWKDFFIDLARKLKLKGVKFVTKRNPEAWERLLNDFVLDEYVLKYDIKEG